MEKKGKRMSWMNGISGIVDHTPLGLADFGGSILRGWVITAPLVLHSLCATTQQDTEDIGVDVHQRPVMVYLMDR